MRRNITDLTGDLVPSFHAEVSDVIDLCKEKNVIIVPYSTLRDPWEQAKLWRQSRGESEIQRAIKRLKDGGAKWLAEVIESVDPQYGNHVTDALPGMSWHQWGEAVDCYVADHAGKPIWDGQHPGYKVYADCAREIGLTAGYYWQNLFDPCHVQARSGSVRDIFTLAEIDRAMRAKFAMYDYETLTAPERALTTYGHERGVNYIDVDTMARTIFGEARGECELGKIAVGWVIMNRVSYAKNHGGYWWGNTIREVCHKESQFSCWNPNDPNKKIIESVTPDDPDFKSCLDIALRVISHKESDPVDGATHYYAGYISKPIWAEGGIFVKEIGVHRFYKGIA